MALTKTFCYFGLPRVSTVGACDVTCDWSPQNTFTRWANEHLKQANKQIDDLQVDLGDGLKLIALLEVLSGKRLPRHNKKPVFRTQKLENVTIALKFLEMEVRILVKE